jgi:drug/metabolite transporter (DMT)-like permease
VTVSLALGLVLALLSAGALNWGFFAQQGAAAKLPRLSLRRPIHSLALLFGNARWLTGFLTGLAGWALYVTALALAPLSLVQAVSAGGIGLLALLVWRALGVRPPDRELVGAGLGVAGLVLLGLSLYGQSGHGSTAAGGAIVLWIIGSLLAAVLAIGARGLSLAPGAGFGAAAGILYAAGDVVTKAAVGGGAAVAFVPAVFALHGLAFVALQFGFQRGGALETAGVATLLTNALPIAAGALVFGEPIPSGLAGVARILAFACVVGGAAFLAGAPGTDERRRLRSVRWRVGSGRFGARRPGSTASGSPSSTRPTT